MLSPDDAHPHPDSQHRQSVSITLHKHIGAAPSTRAANTSARGVYVMQRGMQVVNVRPDDHSVL